MQNGAEADGGANSEIPRSKVLSKMQEICDYKKQSEHGLALNKCCWIVKPDFLEKFQLQNLEIPNNWEYILELPSRNSVSGTPTVNEGNGEPTCETPKSDRPAPSAPGSSLKSKVAPSSLITKFTKVLSDEERQIQLLSTKPAPAPIPAPSKEEQSGASGAAPAKAVKKRIQPTLIAMTAAMNKSQNNSPAAEKPKEWNEVTNKSLLKSTRLLQPFQTNFYVSQIL